MSARKVLLIFATVTVTVGAQVSSSLLPDVEAVDKLLELLVPTSRAQQERCRNDSFLYLQELRAAKVWASEMFDSTAKFPSGVLFGSSVNTGNFDECVEVRIPRGEDLRGKYCMAKYHVTAPKRNGTNEDSTSGYQYNETFWEKVHLLSKDRSRASRSDFQLSYCIPSSCSHRDLEIALNEMAGAVNLINDFQLNVTVEEINCQVQEDFFLRPKDVIFICVLVTGVLLVFCGACYDCLISDPEMQKYKLRGIKHDLLMCFSAWNNMKRLNKKSTNDERMQSLNGIRVFSMFLIILGHRVMFDIGSPIVNPNFVEQFYGRVDAMALLNGPIIVDTFFTLSGFLCSYLLLKELDKRQGKVNVLTLYIHRILRLTPSYAIVLAFYCTLFVKLGSGPFWRERIEVEQERCVTSWWANILYVNNYVNRDQMCMFQSWYLTNDLHLFLVAPPLILLLRKMPKIGLAVIGLLLTLSVAVAFAIVYLGNENAIMLLYINFLRDPVLNSTYQTVYTPTHMRASSYLLGMLAGYLKYHMRTNSLRMPKWLPYCGWLVSVVLLEFSLYSPVVFYASDWPYDPLLAATYAALHHVAWAAGIGWLVLAVTEGYGRWLRALLSWRPLQLLDKLTYSAFLCHGAVQLYTAAIARSAGYISIFNLTYHSTSDIVIAYFFGFLLNIIFEAPIVSLEKIIFRKRERKTETLPQLSTDCPNKIKILVDS